MNILLVEDNKKISDNIKKYLELENIFVDIALDWKIWFDMFVWNKSKYDAVVLDLMIPQISWNTLCTKIREISDVPIIISSAKWEIEDKSELFDIWADDYLVKPFDLEELIIRLNALVRRIWTKSSKKNNYNLLKIWDLDIDLQKKEILKNWKKVELTLKEIYILEILVKNIWIPISRSDIIEFVRWWEEIWQENEKLDVYMANIRKKIWKEYIETIKWFWYKLLKK